MEGDQQREDDDFDEFNEGAGDDEFGDFDEAEDADETPQPEPHSARPSQTVVPDELSGLPPLNLTSLSRSQRQELLTPYLAAIFPDSTIDISPHNKPERAPSSTSPFLSDRSLSLWQQLASPPPMAPPNWTRSRIRRLFLVSLGVPVDLDEILPPSKQKRLVLPNINLVSSPRPSTTLDRLRDDEGPNSSTTSLDSKTSRAKVGSSKRAQRGPPPVPIFDSNAVALLCSTTEAALNVYSDEELRQHVARLEGLNKEASGVLEYWLLRKDEAIKEKEALEGVIENLVGFVKGRRGK